MLKEYMRSEKFDFKNKYGDNLSGRLELPDGEYKALAIFAHCFTCSKNLLAASRIPKELAKHNIGVLRFDFTGLGNSEGDFANTNFSSNVEDLIFAAKALEEKYTTPTLLIGHSFGGAAILKAASELKDVKALVTIGAPSDVSHIVQHFGEQLENIENNGKAQVNLAGREFTIKKQFIDDIEEISLLDQIGKLNIATLIMHSPIDETVSIEHASKIFIASKHPRSFISLDQADHLLSSSHYARYVAKMIASWSLHYIIES